MQNRAVRHRRRGPGAAAQRRAALGRTGAVLSGLALVHGLTALVLGWGLDVPVLRGAVGGLQPIAPVTAVGFIAAGSALLLLCGRCGSACTIAGRLLGAAVGVLGAAVLVEYVTGVSAGTGALLFAERVGREPAALAGLPSPYSALCFVLVGGALVTLRPPDRRTPLLEWFTLPAGFLALQALLGYAYGAESLYRMWPFAPMALPAAAGFLIVATALLCLRPRQGLVAQLSADDAGGFMARRLLVVSLLLPLVIGWIGLQGLRQGLYGVEVGVALIVAAGIFAVTGAVWSSTRVLSRADRRRAVATAAVRASAGRLRRAVEMSPFPQMIHAEDGRILQVNRAWTELTGYTAAELPTLEAWTSKAYGAQSDAALKHIETLYELEHRLENESEFVVRTRDGGERRWLFSSAPLGRLRDGRRLVITAAADLTERTHAEAALRRMNRQLMFLFRATSRLLGSRDPRQLIETLYGEVARLMKLDLYFHYMVAERGGAKHLRLVSHAGVPEAEATRLEVLAFGEPVCGKVAATRRRIVCDSSGQAQPLPETVRPLGVRAYVCHPLIARGDLVGTLSFGTRTRDRFSREELGLLQAVADQVALALDRAQSDDSERSARVTAERASRAKDQFLAVVSHELRTPLTAVVGYTDLLQAEVAGPLSGAQRRFVERMRESAWSLASVIDEILTFARTQAHQEDVRPERTDAVRIVREVIGTVQPEALRKGLSLTTRLPDRPAILHTDGAKLKRILTNLVGNAVKFTDEGEVSVDVRFAAGRLHVDVADTGPGIPADFQERIFEPFIQVDASETRTKNGTGLGLTITRELTALLGGEVRVRSEPGRGTTFTLELPSSHAAAGVTAAGDGRALSRG